MMKCTMNENTLFTVAFLAIQGVPARDERGLCLAESDSILTREGAVTGEGLEVDGTAGEKTLGIALTLTVGQ